MSGRTWTWNTSGPEDTFERARALGARLQGTEVLLLTGDLGAGKTLFTQGLALGGGLDDRQVVSPTFTLMNRLKGPRWTLYHFDLYRLGPQREGLLELEEIWGQGVAVVEWAEYLPEGIYLQEPGVIRVSFTGEDEARRIALETDDPLLYPTLSLSES